MCNNDVYFIKQKKIFWSSSENIDLKLHTSFSMFIVERTQQQQQTSKPKKEKHTLTFIVVYSLINQVSKT